jgi:hypothetical protein
MYWTFGDRLADLNHREPGGIDESHFSGGLGLS